MLKNSTNLKQSYHTSNDKTKFRQTLIWEFMNIKVISPLVKLKVLYKLRDKNCHTVKGYDKFISFLDRVVVLTTKFRFQLSYNLRKYFYNNDIRFNQGHITSVQHTNNINNIFKVYGV